MLNLYKRGFKLQYYVTTLYVSVEHFRKHMKTHLLFEGYHWLEVYLPLWKIWVRQLGRWHSQYMESHKIHVPKHQPEPAKKTSQTKTTANDLFDPSGPMITSPPPSGMVLRTLRQLPQTAKFFGEITACDGGYGRGYGYIYIYISPIVSYSWALNTNL